MVKKLTTAFSLLFLIAAGHPAAAQKGKRTAYIASPDTALKFINAIEVGSSVEIVSAGAAPKPVFTEPQVSVKEKIFLADNAIETASPIQLKYAVLLNTEVEQIQNASLFSEINEWFGTRYVLGGSTKDGVDCSAFVQAVYSKLFGIAMPRTAKEQYKTTRSVSRTGLKQGDLVFFATHGSGVSHVGIYLQNNRFVHASTSGGVMVSDLFEEYWVKHFAGAGRYERDTDTQTLAIKP